MNIGVSYVAHTSRDRVLPGAEAKVFAETIFNFVDEINLALKLIMVSPINQHAPERTCSQNRGIARNIKLSKANQGCPLTCRFVS